MLFITCARLVLSDHPGAIVAIDGDTIRDILTEDQLPADANVVDHGDCVAGPGFIDLHCHGAAGCDFSDGAPDDTRAAAEHHLRRGTTGVLATIASCPLPQMRAALDSTRTCMADVPNVIGAHLEGPYFNREWYGCHLPEQIRTPDADEVAKLRPYRDIIREVTIAPEIDGAAAFIEEFSATGTVFSVGHSNATIDCIRNAMDLGLSHSTHIFNAMPRASRAPIILQPGVLESILCLEELSTEIIGDGIHVGPELVELVHRIKGTTRTSLVSDALRGVGAGPGEYAFGPRDGQMCQIIEDPQVGIVPGSDPLRLASSAITSADAVRILADKTRIPLAELWEMASRSPARVLGLDAQRGRLAPGFRADIVLMDSDMRVAAVYAAGQRVH